MVEPISSESPDLASARNLLSQGGYTCVLQRGDQVITSTRRGVAPLLALLDEGVDAAGFASADRVVGNGAAFLYVLLGVAEVYGEVMSEPAMKTLTDHGISAGHGTLVERIMNRTNTGGCPMEEAVAGISSPDEARAAMVKRLAEMAAANAQQEA